jgi:hypothetical protein
LTKECLQQGIQCFLSLPADLLKDAHGFKTKADLGQWLAKNVEVDLK